MAGLKSMSGWGDPDELAGLGVPDLSAAADLLGKETKISKLLCFGF